MKFYRLFIALCIAVSFTFCVSQEEKEGLQANQNYSGEELAKIYCGSCHQYPEPSLLAADIWQHKVLPVMGQKLGIPDFNLSMASAYVPVSEISVSDSNWQKIKRFYLENGIKGPEQDENEFPVSDLFQVRTPAASRISFTTSLAFSPEREALYVGRQNSLYTYGTDLNPKDSLEFPSPVTHINILPEVLELVCVGKLRPNDEKLGELYRSTTEAESPEPFNRLTDSLKRPVHFASLDLNNNGEEEKVVCEFGHETGMLSVFVREGEALKKIVLSSSPGARKVIGYDFDRNGFKDLMVQFCQGDERISIFYNDQLAFREEVVARFPPVYGSSTFDTLDYNGDGKLDFFCVFGDNGDLTPVLKPYHGLRVFENDQKNSFSEKAFVPIYGATDAKAGDFDQDGDMDFAVIAHFADYKHAPQNSFLIIENEQGLLKPKTLRSLPPGKWLTMEKADYNKDGYDDLFLGAFDLASFRRGGSSIKHYPFVLLENRSQKIETSR